MLSFISYSGTSKHFFAQYTSANVCVLHLPIVSNPPFHSISFQSHLRWPEMPTHVGNPIHPIRARGRSFYFVTPCTPQLPHWAHRTCLFQTDLFLLFIARSVVRPTTQPHVHPSIVQSKSKKSCLLRPGYSELPPTDIKEL